MSRLFEPLTLRGTTFAHRAWVSPMCQYSSVDGFPSSWHLPHLGALATGRPGLLLTEATAVTVEGRISPDDLGLWSDRHATALAPLVELVHGQGVAFGIQLAHAGRKASTWAPWKGAGSVPEAEGGWRTIAPSPVAFGPYAEPRPMTHRDLEIVRDGFAAAARRALAIGADTVEVHAAHGYLLHEFLSPLSNRRDDEYGGSLENRMRYPLEVIAAVRGVWPDDKPLLLRVSATDWIEGGWDVGSTVAFAREAKALGVDLVDVSSAGLHPDQAITVGPGYQVPFAEQVRREAGIPTAAVGLITEAAQAEEVVASGSADAVMLGRAVLREPRWPLLAAHELGADIAWPPQYERARLR
jgi:2,4-dienoyl-CoA reductase-like NADH-dependent reductase (Old Yellow Enzyme family)